VDADTSIRFNVSFTSRVHGVRSFIYCPYCPLCAQKSGKGDRQDASDSGSCPMTTGPKADFAL
jgi:hypothetical protein